MEEKEIENVVNAEATTQYIEKIIASVKLNFDELDTWFSPDTKLPVHSFISLYEACGIKAFIAEYSAQHDNAKVVPVDNVLCNFYTLQHLKRYISNQWAVYSLDIDGDNHVFWDTKKFPEGVKHYHKNLKKRIAASLAQDFANYCCGLDEELEDDVLVFKVYGVEGNTNNEKNEKKI